MSLYWAQTYPKELERAKAEHWPVLLPIGTMEYHSVHCPYGCDTLIAAGITDAIAQKIDAVVLPPVWYGVASYAVSPPDSGTLQIDCEIFEEYLYNILRSLFKSGFDRNIFILNFHQTEDYLPQALAAMKAAKKLIFQYLEETEGMGWWETRTVRTPTKMPPRRSRHGGESASSTVSRQNCISLRIMPDLLSPL